MNANKPNDFQITVLGNGAAMPRAGQYHSAHVVNVHGRHYLLDCGEGTQKSMLEHGIIPQKLEAIFLSHLHGDHLYGLFPLMETLSLSQRTRPLQVFAPTPLKELIACFSRILHGGIPPVAEIHEIDTTAHRVIYETESLEVWTVPLLHRVPSAGYLFREKSPGLNVRKDMIRRHALTLRQILAAKSGEDIPTPSGTLPNTELTYLPHVPRSYAYCTDTLFSNEVARHVQGVDILYHEASFLSADTELARVNGHSTSTQAAEIARLAGAGKLLIGHFSARYKDPSRFLQEARTIFPATEEALQGETYPIPRDRP